MKTFKLNLNNQQEIVNILKSLNNDNYFISTSIYNKLQEIDEDALPLRNRNLVIKQICNFIDYINYNIYYAKDNQLEISKSTFVNIFNTDTYIQFKQLLKDLKILSQVRHKDGSFYDYKEGISKNYRIYNEFLEHKDFTLLIFDKTNKDDLKITIQDELNTQIDNRMINTIQSITIDKEKAIKAHLNEYNKGNISEFKLMLRLAKMYKLDKNRYIKKGNKVNRIFHSFSNIHTLTRQCITDLFYEVDVKNCQPLLLAAYLLQYMDSNDKDYKRYKKHCEDGTFYEKLMVDNVSRQETKRLTYKSIFFNFNRKFKVNKMFKKLYPNVWNTLDYIDKNYNHISLAAELQNLEAKIFNNINIIYSTKYFTLHDAIYFNNKKDMSKLKTQLKKSFMKYDLKVSFSTEINKLDDNIIKEYDDFNNIKKYKVSDNMFINDNDNDNDNNNNNENIHKDTINESFNENNTNTIKDNLNTNMEDIGLSMNEYDINVNVNMNTNTKLKYDKDYYIDYILMNKDYMFKLNHKLIISNLRSILNNVSDILILKQTNDEDEIWNILVNYIKEHIM